MKLKFFSFLVILSGVFFACINKDKSGETMHNKAVLKITADYEKQTGPGSNQWAVWIEDIKGNLVKTIFVTAFTADGGYMPRPACVPVWVSKANPAALMGPAIDAFSGATPESGLLTYTWDLTDNNGIPVKNGEYVLMVEATLFGESEAIFKGTFTVGKEEQQINTTLTFTSEDETNKKMLQSVNAEYVLIKK